MGASGPRQESALLAPEHRAQSLEGAVEHPEGWHMWKGLPWIGLQDA